MKTLSHAFRIGRAGRQSSRRLLRFSLIELLVTVGILTILAALLLPALQRAKAMAYTAHCMNNNKQIGLAWLMYADEYDQNLGACNPFSTGAGDSDTWHGTAPWYIALAGGNYLDPKVFACAADSDQASHKTGPQTGSDWTYSAINAMFSTSYTAATEPKQIALETLPNSYIANYCMGWRNSNGVPDAKQRSSLNTISQNNDPSRFWLATDGARQSVEAGQPADDYGYWYGYMGFGLDEGVWQEATRHSTGRIFILADGHAERFGAQQPEKDFGYTNSLAVGQYYLDQLQLEQEPGGSGAGAVAFSAANPLGHFTDVGLYSKY